MCPGERFGLEKTGRIEKEMHEELLDGLSASKAFEKVGKAVKTDEWKLGGIVSKKFNIAYNPMHQEFFDLIKQMIDTFQKKNSDYAGSDAEDMMKNFMQCENYGIKMSDGIITRMSDKISRFQNLVRTRNQQVEDESLIDTLADLANYSLFLIIALKRESHILVKEVHKDGSDFSRIEERI